MQGSSQKHKTVLHIWIQKGCCCWGIVDQISGIKCNGAYQVRKWMRCTVIAHARQRKWKHLKRKHFRWSTNLEKRYRLKRSMNATMKKRNRLTCPNHGRLAHGERHGYQGEGWEVHAPWSPFLPEGTISSIHSVAVVCQPAWAVSVGCAVSYPLTESQPKRGTRLNLLRGNRQKGTPLETSVPLSRRLSLMTYLWLSTLMHKT